MFLRGNLRIHSESYQFSEMLMTPLHTNVENINRLITHYPVIETIVPQMHPLRFEMSSFVQLSHTRVDFGHHLQKSIFGSHTSLITTEPLVNKKYGRFYGVFDS